MYRVEGDVVDGVDQGLVLRRGSLVAAVAFEGEVVRGILLLHVSAQEVSSRGHPLRSGTRHVLDGNAPLYATDGEAVSARETGNNAGLPFEWRRKGLEPRRSIRRERGSRFRRAADLEGGSRILKVEHLDVALGRAHDHQRVHNIHGITTLRELYSRHRIRCAQVPVLRERCGELVRPDSNVGERITVALALIVLSQLPVVSTPPCGDSIHRTTRMGASCWATWDDCPVVTSNIRPALSAPPERIFEPS